jgi:hypothetical protein
VAPADGVVVALDPDIPPRRQRVTIIASSTVVAQNAASAGDSSCPVSAVVSLIWTSPTG